MLKKIQEILEFIKSNLEVLIEFLANYAIEISIQHKNTSETKKTIKITNLFLIFVLLILIAGFFLAAKIKSLFL